MSTATQRRRKSESEVRNVSVDFRGKLDAGEFLTGSVFVVEVGTADLTTSNQGVSIAVLTINNQSVPAGKALQFKVSGGVAGTTYTLRVHVSTTSSPPQTLYENLLLHVIADS